MPTPSTALLLEFLFNLPEFFQRRTEQTTADDSIFLVAEPDDQTAAVLHHSEHMLRVIEPANCTIDRMRTTIEDSLREVSQRTISQSKPMQDCSLMAALYSPIDRQCALFRTSGGALREFVGYDCQGPAAYLGHHLIRDRYRAAQSMDSLSLSTAFAICTDTLEAVRARVQECGDWIEVVVMYGNGHASDVQRMRPDTRRERTLGSLGALGRRYTMPTGGVGARILKPGSRETHSIRWGSGADDD